ncbi:cyclin-F-like [Sinocyclocheilus rhinocerous]|uniref:cyclin-F-like n=1 Tax=Sinocyclocheilus rhinocerous TaxID=307959 RepID=UPI0007BAA11A|nr:PREDICTED: cyclin-F-like [Sinocyclocheilus rhinocerous]
MKAGVLHCRCAKCFSLPLRKRVRKRASAVTLLSLPEELLLCVLQCLSAEDLLAVRAVHSHLRDVIDSNSSVWARVSFKDRWPVPDTVWLFERAAEKGNFEAAAKLGIAYLYNEGPSLSEEGRADLCGRMASRYFSLAESLRSPLAEPFIWLFIRPPWSMSGGCCKAVVYDRLEAECETNLGRRGTLLYCLARVLRLFDDEEKRDEATAMLKESARCGNVQSSYLLWEMNRGTSTADPGRYLQCMRTLRDYAAKGCWEAQLAFAKSCGTTNPLSLEPRACAELVAQFFHSGPSPLRYPQNLQGQDITTKSFGQDVPKDYRHVSLTGVKQRFEDDVYQQISRDAVMGFKELCQVLEVPEVEPQVEAPSASSQLAEMHTFLSSPASNSKRRREDSMQAHRGSFLATPTAELSTQEEMLLGDILDWSLDTSCSGYEGDRESEGEKDREISAMEVQMEPAVECADRQTHCCALSSDDDSLCEEHTEEEATGPWKHHLSSSSSSTFCTDRRSLGYSSIQSVPSPSVSSSLVSPQNPAGFLLLLPPAQRTRRQVKRKNTAAHSGGEAERDEDAANVAFLSL